MAAATTQSTRYRLKVSAGPSTDPKTLKPITVNDDANPLLIDTDEFIAQIVIRIRGLDKTLGYQEAQKQDGLKSLPDSPWFTKPGGDNNLSSVQISCRFKREWSGDQVVFGVSGTCCRIMMRDVEKWPPIDSLYVTTQMIQISSPSPAVPCMHARP